jgi:hemerythrin-like domain-containing protein
VEEFTALYRRHIASEDSALTAYARSLLTPEDRAAIATEMLARRHA